MKVLDLFSGMGGWSSAFLERGHQVLRIEKDPKFAGVPHTETADIFDCMGHVYGWKPDVILASPPCEGFSVARIGTNWRREGGALLPKTEKAELGLALVARTLEVIRQARPRFWVIENPVGALRKMPLMAGLDRRTITFCQFGEARMKPTDLWSDYWPAQIILPPACKQGATCHEASPRGSATGTQGLANAALRAQIPYALSLRFCLGLERFLAEQPRRWYGDERIAREAQTELFALRRVTAEETTHERAR